jgi:hypothetical protein
MLSILTAAGSTHSAVFLEVLSHNFSSNEAAANAPHATLNYICWEKNLIKM